MNKIFQSKQEVNLYMTGDKSTLGTIYYTYIHVREVACLHIYIFLYKEIEKNNLPMIVITTKYT